MQTIKAQKTKYSGKALAVTAMFAALITAATAFIKIPAPLGYAHAGDSVIYLAACILPAPFGFIAASVGGALADLLSGYAVWAICHQGAECAAVFSRTQISPKERPRHAHFASAHPCHAAAHHRRYVSRLLCRQHGFVRLSCGLGGGAVQSGAVSRRRRSVYRPGTHARCGKIQAKNLIKITSYDCLSKQLGRQ